MWLVCGTLEETDVAEDADPPADPTTPVPDGLPLALPRAAAATAALPIAPGGVEPYPAGGAVAGTVPCCAAGRVGAVGGSGGARPGVPAAAGGLPGGGAAPLPMLDAGAGAGCTEDEVLAAALVEVVVVEVAM